MQAIFIKSSNGNPTCDLKRVYCSLGPSLVPDAYVSEQHLGNILRYLKCCTLDDHGHSTGVARYPNLKQVFITSRIYGGYATGDHGCLMPEPFAYEEGIGVQRLIVAQINRTADAYTGNVRYPEDTPWFDWGPYIWANGANLSPGNQLFWCDSTTRQLQQCQGNLGDFRYGDDADPTTYWGDHTHPTYKAQEKVANQLVIFIGKDPLGIKPGSPFVTPWIVK